MQRLAPVARALIPLRRSRSSSVAGDPSCSNRPRLLAAEASAVGRWQGLRKSAHFQSGGSSLTAIAGMALSYGLSVQGCRLIDDQAPDACQDSLIFPRAG